jgi:Polysaccharide lyase
VTPGGRVLLLTSALAAVLAGACSHARAVSPGQSSRGRGGLLWRGDYQTGDFRQWSRLQAVPGGAAIVTSPTHHGRYTARYVVRPGDDPIGSNGERAEARASQAQTGAREGLERWYGWSTLFPANANLPPSTDSWNIFTQWHQTASDGCPPNIAFQADTSHAPPAIKLRVLGGGGTRHCTPTSTLLRRPAQLRLDHWYDFVVHVKWSSDPSVGFIEGWIDGAKAIPRVRTATLYRGQGAYLKQGFYRAGSALTTTVYHAGTRAGTRYRAVVP